MIVIYEQDYDLVSIHDIIEEKEIFNYVEHYKKRLLSEKHVIKITDEKVDKNYNGGFSYYFKLQYDYEGNPEEWTGFDTVRFDKTNNFKNK